MKIRSPFRCTLGLSVAAALLAGCGGSQPPIVATGAVAPTAAVAAHADRDKSWMDSSAGRIKRLLYVSNEFYGNVYVYNFDTGAEVGILTGFEGPQGQCVDAAGDVWIADSLQSTGYYTGRIVEYQHGATTPKEILTGYGLPTSCAVDPKSGDLAVVNSGGGITIFKPSGSLTNFVSPECQYMGSPGFDDQGNLYVEGWSQSYGGQICELPAHGTHLVTRKTDVSGVASDGIMWDGKHLTVEAPDQTNPDVAVIYRVVSRGASGKLITVGRTLLRDKACGGAKAYQPFMVGKRNTPVNKEEAALIVGSNLSCGYRLDYWRYTGGKLQRHLSDAPRNPFGESVSIRE
jgi:hypothetical protein